MNSIIENEAIITTMSFCRATTMDGRDIVAVIRDIFFSDYTDYTGKSYHGKEVSLTSYDQFLYNVRPIEHWFDVSSWYFSLYNIKIGDEIRLRTNSGLVEGLVSKAEVVPNGSTGWTAYIHLEGEEERFLFLPDCY
jgi:hypothetical protein